MEHSILQVEQIASYIFRNKNLLEEALTQDSPSYQRLKFLGEAVLLKAANINTEKIASVALGSRLYVHMKPNTAAVDHEVREFTNAICKEGDPVAHGGSMKAPKVLADVVKSLAAAIYVDLNFDLYEMWLIFELCLNLLLPLKTRSSNHNLSRLLELCQHSITDLLRLTEQNKGYMKSVLRESGRDQITALRRTKGLHTARNLYHWCKLLPPRAFFV